MNNDIMRDEQLAADGYVDRKARVQSNLKQFKKTKPTKQMNTEAKETQQFTKQQIKDWRAFERVRSGGRFNMFDPRARQSTGLGGEEYAFCMEHYSALKLAANS
jgi:hypothetical protein